MTHCQQCYRPVTERDIVRSERTGRALLCSDCALAVSTAEVRFINAEMATGRA